MENFQNVLPVYLIDKGSMISMDHCYAKPWSAHPDASNARPIKKLFMPKPTQVTQMNLHNREPDIDVCLVTENHKPAYDMAKARSLMQECGRHVPIMRTEETAEDWEDRITRNGWSLQQNRLFNKVMKALQSDRLARLTYVDTRNEPVMRRIHIDKTSRRIRQALAGVSWEPKLTQWLHNLLIENLSIQMLGSYLDVLQTLRAKLPTMIDKMVAVGLASGKSATSIEALHLLLKRPWDPVLSTYNQQKPQKLPGNPLIVVAPSVQCAGSHSYNKRMRFWNSQLSNLGKVVPVTMHTINPNRGMGVTQCLEHMVGAVQSKVQELKGHFQNKPIILLGWDTGALIACHVALQETVTAVVCLGMPLSGIHGYRGDVEDPLMDSTTPTMFVIGQHSTTTNVDDIEDMREKMRAENSLVVVGGADNQLRMSRAKKKKEGITQIICDKKIMDEISEFLGGILSQTTTQFIETTETVDIEMKKKPKKRTEKFVSVPGSGSVKREPVQQYDRSGQPITQKRKSSAMLAPPRKRIKSTSDIKFSPAMTHAIQNAPELSGLLRGQRQIQDIKHEINIQNRVLKEGSALYSDLKAQLAAKATAHQALASGSPMSSAEIKAQLAAKAAAQQSLTASLGASSGESVKQVSANTMTSLPMSSDNMLSKHLQSSTEHTLPSLASTLTSLQNALRSGSYKPSVHVTSAQSMTSHIHQLLTSVRAAEAAQQAQSKQPKYHNPTILSSLKSPVKSMSSIVDVSACTMSSPHDTAVSPSHSSTTQTDTEKLMAIQKLQFHDFPLTTASLIKFPDPVTMSQSKILTPLNLTKSSVADDVSSPAMKMVAPLNLTKSSMAEDISSPAVKMVAPLNLTKSSLSEEKSRSSPAVKMVSSRMSTDTAGTMTLESIDQSPPRASRPSIVSTVTEGNIVTVSLMSDKSIIHSAPSSAKVTLTPSPAIKPVVSASTETLGKVNSLLESSPVTQKTSPSIVAQSSSTHITHTITKTVDTSPKKTSASAVSATITAAKTSKSAPAPVTSYTATPKPVLSTIATTRTRRIRTPKQYDL